MEGDAVKVTSVPAQIVVAAAAIATVTGKPGFTVMAISLDVAGLPDAQIPTAVIITVILSLFDNVREV